MRAHGDPTDRFSVCRAQAWLNEKFSPEILPYLGDVVDCLLDQLTHMQENLQQIDKGDFRVTIHRMEVNAIGRSVDSLVNLSDRPGTLFWCTL